MTQDVASGVIPVMIAPYGSPRGGGWGKVRRLAVTSNKRFPGLPDLPSLSESVRPGHERLVRRGRQRARPRPIARLNRAIGDYLQS
jgi:tripartite-type tricarboxylate transporter receptor subunit TctC